MSTIGLLIVQGFVAFVATVAFAILFHVPREYFIHCGITGASGWMCYKICLLFQPSVVIASMLAAVLLTLLSRAFAVNRRCPITVFLINGIFPLVPGAGIYYSSYYFILGDNTLFSEKASETFKIAVAIALGIVFVVSIPGAAFKVFAPKSKD